MSRNRLLILSISASFRLAAPAILAVVACMHDARASCKGCEADLVAYQELVASQAKYNDLLRRNREYLEKNGQKFPSQAIKVKSNVLVIMLRLEATKNNIEGTRQELAKKGCSQCLTIPGR